MKNYIWIFILIFFVNTNIRFSDYGVLYLQNKNNTYRKYLSKKYIWYSDYIFDKVIKECKINPIVVFSIINVESRGNPFAVGKPVKVFLYRNGKLTSVYSKAIGLMQVMDFYKNSFQDLFDIDKNIELGCSILNECFYLKKELHRAISCYSTGKNSLYYNSKYVKKVIGGL